MKTKKRLYLAVLLLVVIVIGLFFMLRKSSDKMHRVMPRKDYKEISEIKQINIVTNYSHDGYYISGDTACGFNAEMIKLLQKQTKLKVEVNLESDLNKTIEGLHNNTYDIVIRNMPITESMRKVMNFTQPIIYGKAVLIQRREESNNGIKPLRNSIQLAKKTVYIPKNSPFKVRLLNLARELGDSIYIKEDPNYTEEQLIIMVSSKDIDYTICDEELAKEISKSIPEIDYKTSVGFTHLEGWGVRKNAPVLLDSLNIWLDRIKKTKEFLILNKKYKNFENN